MTNQTTSLQRLDQFNDAPVPQRWIKINVDEEVFHHVHIVAAQSRMRLACFLRKYLADAKPYPTPAIP